MPPGTTAISPRQQHAAHRLRKLFVLLTGGWVARTNSLCPCLRTVHRQTRLSVPPGIPARVCLGTTLVLLALLVGGCGAVEGIPLANETLDPVEDERFQLVARFVHISDAHVIDEESPGRLTALANLASPAWRPHERFSTQLLDGMIRAINDLHRLGHEVNFVIHTGDAVDNAQTNELRWFLDLFDGLTIDPLSGSDDRQPADRGDPWLDPHRAFQARGLYQEGRHGSLPSIDWYNLVGNHDRYACGLFPIFSRIDGSRFATLPGPSRVGLFLPTALVPDGSIAYGPVTPANPGPPPDINLPTVVPANPDRRFLTPEGLVQAHFDTLIGPEGHGFYQPPTTTYYSSSPVSGLRLIALDTSQAAVTIPAGVYVAGAVVAEQARFLIDELERASAADEIVVVATHHPSADLSPLLGTALSPDRFRALLNEYPNVVLHLAGHQHRHRVWDHDGYLEIETGAVLDYPQEGRVIEIWRADDEIELRYAVFSHLCEGQPFDDVDESDFASDPLLPMRRFAFELACEHAQTNHLFRSTSSAASSDGWPSQANASSLGQAADRDGTFRFSLSRSAQKY